MRKITSVLVLVIACGVSGMTHGETPAGACGGDTPLVVLECLSKAWSEKNFEGISQIYASEYQYVAKGQQGGAPMNREQELAAAAAAFNTPEAGTVRLEFSPGARVVAGTDPDTWILEDVEMIQTVAYAPGSGKSDIKLKQSGNRISVKRFRAPHDHYEITRWELD